MAEKKEPEIKILTTERPEGPEDKSILKTPSGATNVEVITMTWYSQVGIRVLRTYLQSLLGFILAIGTGAAGGVGLNIPAQDFLQLLISSGSLAVAPAAIALLQNMVEILGKFDVTNPQLRA